MNEFGYDSSGIPYQYCIDCGLLAGRIEQQSARQEIGDLVEVDVVARDGWRTATRPPSPLPVCSANKRKIRVEFFELREAALARGPVTFSEENGMISAVLMRPYPCTSFIEWEPTFSPKEHREMLDRQQLLEWQTNRDDWIRAEVAKREDARDEAMRTREDARDKKLEVLQRELHKSELRWLGGAVTLAVVGGLIVAAVIEGLLGRGADLWPF